MTPEEDARKEFESCLERLKRTSISIGRIPEKYKTRFMEIAKEEFEGDYGMLLRELIRTWDGIYVDSDEGLKIKIDLLAEEISKLKEALAKLTQKPTEEVKYMADGKTKRIG